MQIFRKNPFGEKSRCVIIQMNTGNDKVMYGVEYGLAKIAEIFVEFPDREFSRGFSDAINDYYKTEKISGRAQITEELVCPYKFCEIAETIYPQAKCFIQPKHHKTIRLLQPSVEQMLILNKNTKLSTSYFKAFNLKKKATSTILEPIKLPSINL